MWSCVRQRQPCVRYPQPCVRQRQPCVSWCLFISWFAQFVCLRMKELLLQLLHVFSLLSLRLNLMLFLTKHYRACVERVYLMRTRSLLLLLHTFSFFQYNMLIIYPSFENYKVCAESVRSNKNINNDIAEQSQLTSTRAATLAAHKSSTLSPIKSSTDLLADLPPAALTLTGSGTHPKRNII